MSFDSILNSRFRLFSACAVACVFASTGYAQTSPSTSTSTSTESADAAVVAAPTEEQTSAPSDTAESSATPAEVAPQPAQVEPARPVVEVPKPAAVAAPEPPKTIAPVAPVAAVEKSSSDLRAPSPRVLRQDRKDFFQAGVGPAYGIGFGSDSLLYNVSGSYNFNMNERVTGKALGDLYMGTGSVSSRMINLGLGADVFFPDANPFTTGLPYLSGVLALGNGRNALEETAIGLSLGAGAGFRVRASDLNLDISANYSYLTKRVGDTNPSIIGARVAVAF